MRKRVVPSVGTLLLQELVRMPMIQPPEKQIKRFVSLWMAPRERYDFYRLTARDFMGRPMFCSC